MSFGVKVNRVRLVMLAFVVAVALAAFVIGRVTSPQNADGPRVSSNRSLTVRVGDQLEAPSIALFCTSYVELGISKLLCNRTGDAPRWQVIFERDRTKIGRIGDPGDQRIFPER